MIGQLSKTDANHAEPLRVGVPSGRSQIFSTIDSIAAAGPMPTASTTITPSA